jgi:hypothetical protein
MPGTSSNLLLRAAAGRRSFYVSCGGEITTSYTDARMNYLRTILAIGLLMTLSAPAMSSSVCPIPAVTSCIASQGDWTNTLTARSFDGSPTIGGYFDSSLNITWLRIANVDGLMTWDNANTWATTLGTLSNPGPVNGITGWRLPTMIDTGSVGCNFGYVGTDCGFNVQTAPGATPPTGNLSEMAHMFYVTLGNLAAFKTNGLPESGSGLINTGPFDKLENGTYWTNLVFGPVDPGSLAWYFNFADTRQSLDYQGFNKYAWAVHDGDPGIAPVPLPASVWLLLTGVLGFAVLNRGPRTEYASACLGSERRQIDDNIGHQQCGGDRPIKSTGKQAFLLLGVAHYGYYSFFNSANVASIATVPPNGPPPPALML